MLLEVAGEQVVSNDGDAESSETVAAVGTGCGRCGKRSHKTEDCTTNMTGVKCFKCGKTGHIGRNCLNQGQNKNEEKKPSKGGNQGQKGKPPNPKAKPKAKAKGKGQGKGKMYELGEGEEEQEEGYEDTDGGEAQEEASGSGLQMALLGSFGTSFFFLWYGRSRSEARSLHEKKLLVRKLLHGRRWSHAAWQIKTAKTQTKNTRQDADPPARYASHHPKDSKANSKRGKSPTRKTTKDLPRHSGKNPLCRNKLKNMQQTN